MKKILIVVSFAVLLLLSLVFMNTYALFQTDGVASKNLSIGRWIIKINDIDTMVSQNISLNDFVYDNSIHTQNEYFAPGSDAYFDVEIDASLTDVSVLYTIDVDDSDLEDHPNIGFSIENLDTEETVSVLPMEGVIALSSNNRTINLRVHLTWSNNTLYDDADTSLIDGNLSFVLTANFKQYLGQ